MDEEAGGEMTMGYVIEVEMDETIDGQNVWFVRINKQLVGVAYTKTEVCKIIAGILERSDDLSTRL